MLDFVLLLVGYLDIELKSRDCVCLLVAPLSVTVDVRYPPFLINYRLW